jgi:hypothetical protein
MLSKCITTAGDKGGKNDAVIHRLKTYTIARYTLSTFLKMNTQQMEMRFKTGTVEVVIQSLNRMAIKLID